MASYLKRKDDLMHSDNRNNKEVIITSLFWRYGERISAQGVQFVVSIILARLLSPKEYGYIGLIIAFIAIGNVFVQSGFGNALIQKADVTEEDFSSVFFVSIFIGIIIFIVMFFLAPVIAKFYGEPILISPIRVLSLMLIFAGINTVQQAYVSRKMIFRKFFFATIIGTIVSAVVGISLAYTGFGIWALVWQQLTNQIVGTMVLWVTVKWRPKASFSVVRINELFSFGGKLLVSSLLDSIYNNMYTFVLGKTYKADIVGYYNRGKNIPNLVITNINSSIQSVLFPALSKEQSDPIRVKQLVRRSIVTSTFLIFPCMAGLGATAKGLTIILLTEKWLPSVPFMQFCCFIYAFWPIHTANLQAISAIGRSDIYLKLEIIKKIIGVVIIVITLPLGIYPMMIGNCINTVIASFLNAYPNKRLLSYSYIEQMRDILPSFILSVFMMSVILCFNFLNWNPWLTLATQVIVGILIYVFGAKIFKFESFEYIISTSKQFFKK